MKVILDTPPSVQAAARKRMMEKSCIERMIIGANLSAMMRSFAAAGVAADGHTGQKFKAELAMRLYGRKMTPEARKKLYDRIMSSSP